MEMAATPRKGQHALLVIGYGSEMRRRQKQLEGTKPGTDEEEQITELRVLSVLREEMQAEL